MTKMANIALDYDVRARKGGREFRFRQYLDLTTGHWVAEGGNIKGRLERPTLDELVTAVSETLADVPDEHEGA